MDSFVVSLSSLLPMLVVAVTALVVMIAIAIKRSHFWVATLSVIGLNAALAVLMMQAAGYIPSVDMASSLFSFDGFAKFNMGAILIASLACCTLSYCYFETLKGNKDELYFLMLVATLGAMMMTGASHLASFFMSLELLSVPMYGMLAYTYLRPRAIESGLKYLILSAAASATLLMGMALIYVDTGTLVFKSLAQVMLSGQVTALFAVGALLMLVAIAFKLSAAPFHSWVSDVYEGAPVPISAFLASVSKVAMMALAVRFIIDSQVLSMEVFDTILVLIIVLSIVIGNLLAISQKNLKRMLAYSSIAHVGYALIALLSVGAGSAGLVSMYMAVYALTSIGAFGVVTLMSSPYRERGRTSVSGEADDMRFYQGLFWHRPILTAVLTVMLLSLAGIPLTAGFITKFTVFFAAVQGVRFWAAGMIILGSAIGLYYYLRVLVNLYQRPKLSEEYDAHADWGIKAGGLMVMIVTILVLLFGIVPEGLMQMAGYAILK